MQILIEHSVRKQEILIRHSILRPLIWVCTVCLCPTKRPLGLYGLVIVSVIWMEESTSESIHKFCHLLIMITFANSLDWQNDGLGLDPNCLTLMVFLLSYGYFILLPQPLSRERSGSVVECLTRDRRAAGSSLTGVTGLWSLSKTHLS